MAYSCTPISAGKVRQHPPGYHKHPTTKQHVYDNKTHITKTMSEQPSTRLAERIKEARNRLNLSQSEAATEWGISKRTLQQWEQGRREPRGLYREKVESILAASAPKRKPRR